MTRHPSRVSARGAVLGLISLCLGGLLSPQASAAFKYLQEGMTAPELSGEDLTTGKTVTSEILDAEDGTVLVITFWATWSQRSLEILQDLKAMASDYEGRPFRVIAVNVESPDITKAVRDEIEAKVRELDLPFPVILDENLETFYTYGVVAVPSTAVVDADGILRYGPAGYSYMIRDRLVDSTQVLLGLKERTEAVALERGYVPEVKSSRYYNLALQLYRQRLYERALTHLAKSSQADSAFSAPSNLRGQIMLELDRPDEAAVEFEHAVELDEQSVAAWAGWGRALLHGGQEDAAREKLRTALDLDDSYTEAMLDLAVCLLSAKEDEAALNLLSSARELNPRDPAAYLILGRYQESLGHTTEALATYRTALEDLYSMP
jgi:tetratricopeptide (TPR) repeat protein